MGPHLRRNKNLSGSDSVTRTSACLTNSDIAVRLQHHHYTLRTEGIWEFEDDTELEARSRDRVSSERRVSGEIWSQRSGERKMS
jgi:hypothetical protein